MAANRVQEFGIGHFAKMKQGEKRRVGSQDNSNDRIYQYEAPEEEKTKPDNFSRKAIEKCYCKLNNPVQEEEEDRSILNTSFMDNSLHIPKEDEDMLGGVLTAPLSQRNVINPMQCTASRKEYCSEYCKNFPPDEQRRVMMLKMRLEFGHYMLKNIKETQGFIG